MTVVFSTYSEVGDPRYILDLLAPIVTVSLETMNVVDAVPALKIGHSAPMSGQGDPTDPATGTVGRELRPRCITVSP